MACPQLILTHVMGSSIVGVRLQGHVGIWRMGVGRGPVCNMQVLLPWEYVGLLEGSGQLSSQPCTWVKVFQACSSRMVPMAVHSCWSYM